MLITVFYSCEKCGLVNRKCIVPERDPNDDVVKYVKKVLAQCIAADHSSVSPICKATHITEVKIPIDPSNPSAPIGSKIGK